MTILSRLEGWSFKIFLKKIVSRAIPIAATWLALKIKIVSPDAFAGLDPDQVKLTFSAVLWAGFTLAANLLKFSYSEKGGA